MHFLSVLFPCVLTASASSQEGSGRIEGFVTLSPQDTPIHGAAVLIVQSGLSTETDDDGRYRFESVPPGRYSLIAHVSSALASQPLSVEVAPGETARLDFRIELSPVRETVTVTAQDRIQSTFESFQSVTSLNSFDLAANMAPSIGEVLENQPGVAKRSFGPGSSRPIIRGFDGNRVLIMQDGMSTGTLSYASGDHGELIDPASLERLEVVKGPATLLYGSNALGGVVNAISGHFEGYAHPHPGIRGSLSGTGGSTNAHGGGNAGLEYGSGRWLVWANGGGQRTGDYDTPLGEIQNSKTRVVSTEAGVGWYGDEHFFSVGYRFTDGRYGVPFAAMFEGGEEDPAEEAGEEELIDLDARLQNVRLAGGLGGAGPVQNARVSLNFSDWNHKELEGDVVGTTFDNRQWSYRAVFEQEELGPLTGQFGIWGNFRDYETVGAEALAPPVDQKGFALFGLQELGLGRFALQFGGRAEYVSYDPVGFESRSLTGVSAAAGVRVALWEDGNLVANYTHSYRAPTLEELYNEGPHIGLLTFEVGDPNLDRELGNGVDLSVRHSGNRVRAEASYYYYDLTDFIFLAPTGEIEDGLRVGLYSQGDSRFTGAEAGLDLALRENLWLNLGIDVVDARLTSTDTPLPRIPPLRGRIGVDARYKDFSFKPELILASEQSEVFLSETPTEGYAVVNLKATYTLAREHTIHAIHVDFFNIGNELYRNHMSFIKDLAPEIGRGVRVNYTLRFF